MRKRLLGRTGLQVSEIALGGLFISDVGGLGRDEAVRTIRRALDLGINYLDTAPGYHDSEEVLGIALEGVPQDSYIISTKLGYQPEPFRPKDRDFLRRSVERSLKALKRDTVDILMIHEPDRPDEFFDWWDDFDTATGPVTELLQDLKEEGVTRFIGVGGTTAYEMPRILATGRFDVLLTAFNYSLLWREAEVAVLPEAKRQGVGIIAGSPLQQGALARRYDEDVNGGAPWLSPPRRDQYKKLYAYLDELGTPLTELAMRWVITNRDIATVLTGVRSVRELEENVRAVEAGPLPAEVMMRLQEIADMVPFRPFREPFGLPFGRERRSPGLPY